MRRDTSPLKGLKVRDESEESPRPKDKVQRIVQGGRLEHQTRGPKHTERREQEWDMVTVTVSSVVDGEWYEGRVV